MEKKSPEALAREVVDACSDCDVCRFLMDSSCLLFPELYRLFDKEAETGKETTSPELRRMLDLCNFCALCPCPNIRVGIMKAKTAFIDRDGLKLTVRTLEDVERVCKICGAYPRLSNFLFKNNLTSDLIKKAAGINRNRVIPEFPPENFPGRETIIRRGGHKKNVQKRKIAYFPGCTAKYLFPEVAKAVVDIFTVNGMDVYCIDHKCCGMPTMLEGDRKTTSKFAYANIEKLSEIVNEGYDIVCSCPTCGFMLKTVIAEGAYYSRSYQEFAGGGDDAIRVPHRRGPGHDKEATFTLLKKTIYQHILKDDGYFSHIEPLKRVAVAESTYDLGEYLKYLYDTGELKIGFNPTPERIVYYPPCHQREQKTGRPYLDLLNEIPGLDIEFIDGNLYCCGMAGIMGFKSEFHDASIELGSPLFKKIEEMATDKVVTDCLSCRLQFNQVLNCEILHPVEILTRFWMKFRK